MKTYITNTFKKSAKKLHRDQIKIIEETIEAIQKNPLIGDAKLGDLQGIRVYKFHLKHQLILLAYKYEEAKKCLTLLAFGPHENFYDKLKNQVK